MPPQLIYTVQNVSDGLGYLYPAPLFKGDKKAGGTVAVEREFTRSTLTCAVYSRLCDSIPGLS